MLPICYTIFVFNKFNGKTGDNIVNEQIILYNAAKYLNNFRNNICNERRLKDLETKFEILQLESNNFFRNLYDNND